MRHDHQRCIIIMLRSLKKMRYGPSRHQPHGTGAPAFDAAVPMLARC
jgi:hypothetical protein